jgi:hypothetical protein
VPSINYLSQALKDAAGFASAEAEKIERNAIKESLERFIQLDETKMGERYKENSPS